MKQLDLEVDHAKALLVFFRVVQASISDFVAMDTCYSFAHALALKLFRHMSTMQKLCQPHLDPTTGDMIVDHSTVQAITRSAVETYLTFTFIFGPEDKALVRLRFAIWQRCGLMGRQKYTATTSESKEQMVSELTDIETLKAEIEATPLFMTEYTEPQRERLIKKGDWNGVNKMPMLAQQAGMHRLHFRNLYKHASGHSHASYISAMQVTQARNLETQRQLAIYCLGTNLQIMMYFLTMFTDMSPRAKQAFNVEPHSKELFARWYITEEQWEKLYSDQAS